MKKTGFAMLLVFILTLVGSWVDAAESERPRTFDLASSLEEVAAAELAVTAGGSATAGLFRQPRSAMLLGAAVAPTGDSGGGISPKRLPDDWLVGGFDTTSRWVTLGTFVGLGRYFALADTDDVR